MLLGRFMRGTVVMVALAATALLAASSARARPAYAAKEGLKCEYCHIAPAVGINFRGLYYRAHNHSFADFDNVYEAKAAGVSPDAMAADAEAKTPDYPDVKVPPALNFVVKDIDGKTVHLARYQGSVILVVNVASFSSNTPQYAALEKLYEKYRDKGFVILGFPSNAFNQQEPGDNKTIKAFCTGKYKVTFPMFSKIVVKGDGQAPLYKYLTDKKTDPTFGGDLDGSFAKFLIGRNGEIVNGFKANADPRKTPDIPDAIEKELAITLDTVSNRASSFLFAAERNSLQAVRVLLSETLSGRSTSR
ncbi:MAG: Glutathione peroxidase [Chthonomonadaceae bacterium]|nr:Glutathione peroxidase [Chthonomonadaceae bacterium]